MLIEKKMPEDYRVLLYQYLKAKETYKNVRTYGIKSFNMKIWEKTIGKRISETSISVWFYARKIDNGAIN